MFVWGIIMYLRLPYESKSVRLPLWEFVMCLGLWVVEDLRSGMRLTYSLFLCTFGDFWKNI